MPINIQIQEDDIFLVAYPKSGVTWVRFLIGNYITGNKCDFVNSHLYIPDVHFNPEQIEKLRYVPRIIKSHYPFISQFNKVIYLVRNGFDVCLSYYFHFIKYKYIPKNTPFSSFLSHFNKGILDDYGLWNDHIISWINNKNDNFMLIYYENLLHNPEEGLRNILKFSGIPVDEKNLISAVNSSSFSSMQKLEKNQYNDFKGLRNSDMSINFIRNGKIGESMNYFSDEEKKRFIQIHGKALERLGYLKQINETDWTINLF